MKEEFLYYIWEQKMFVSMPQVTTDGRNVEVIDVGKRNRVSGPDFFNAKVRIGDTVWVGNVEMHCKASDWYKHEHQDDPAYENVILHVVMENDVNVTRLNGEPLTQMILQWPEWLNDNYKALYQAKPPIHCQKKVGHIPEIFITDWKNRLVIERWHQKYDTIEQMLRQNAHNWEETFYWIMARNFGFHTNSLPFEWTARSLPLIYIAKHKNNLMQIEAMLFGQAGLLPETAPDDYTEKLIREYSFLRNKFSLTPIKQGVWKKGGVRPSNSPYVRIAQFAALLHESSKLFSKILEIEKMDDFYALFQVQASDYWKKHTQFGIEGKERAKTLGKNSINTILINTVFPTLFVYGRSREDEAITERALNFLQKLPAEDNTIIHQWEEAGIKCQNAFDTQALLQLWHCYCSDRKCLRCRIGHQLLTRKQKEDEQEQMA